MLLATYRNDREKFNKVIYTLLNNENSEGRCESVLKVLGDYDAIGDMHFIGERDYYTNILERFKNCFR